MAVDAQFHVLAVDDSLIDRKLIERLLKSSSFEVTAVDSGSKALELLGLQEDLHDHQDFEVNLIITDYCMPGMTGYDLLRKIKESKNLKDIPVVIMSSENIPSRISRCLEEGAQEFLLKPVQLSDVDKLKPHLMRSKSKDDDYFEAHCKRKSDDECVSPNKSRMKMADELEIEVPRLSINNSNPVSKSIRNLLERTVPRGRDDITHQKRV